MATLKSYALCEVADVKEILGIDAGNTTKDNLIIRRINLATALIESFCNLPRDHHFKSTTYTDEVYDGLGGDQLVLRMRPVITLSSFKYLDSPESDSSYSDVPSDLYFSNLSAGTLNGLFTQNRWWSSYKVTYTAGYATIPDDLAEACANLAAFWIENATTGTNVKRKTEGQRSIEYFESGGQNEDSLIETLGLDDVLNRYIFYAL